jgi:hypothetical protein
MVTPIYFLHAINDAAAPLLARGQITSLASIIRSAMPSSEVFWGLWLFPFGLLVYRSRFPPRILDLWLMLNCFAYLATSVTGIFGRNMSRGSPIGFSR